MTIEERAHLWYCDMQTAESEQEGDEVVKRHLSEAIAEEREACAAVCNELAQECEDTIAERGGDGREMLVGILMSLARVCRDCATAILERGEK